MIYYFTGQRETYMGPVWDVNGGSAILEDESNRFTVTTHLRARLHDPETLKDEEVINVPPLRPARRLREKAPIGADGLAVRSFEKDTARDNPRSLSEGDPGTDGKGPDAQGEAAPVVE